MVTNDQHPNAFGIHNAKQNRVRETVNDTAPDLRFDERKQQWTIGYSIDGRIDLAPEF